MAAAHPFEQTVDVETPELVVLTYSVAGVGSRMLAALTDLFICLAAIIVLVLAIAVLQPGDPLTSGVTSSWAAALLVLLQFAVRWGYYVLFEGLMDGQTPGKRIHHLRVVREGGFSVGFAASAVRNLVRILDMQPLFLYLVGFGSILVSKRGQRLGDLVAGTIVVREALRETRPPAPALREGRGSPARHSALSEEE